MSAYADRLEALVADAADRCTGCGKCFEVCPTAREIGLDLLAALGQRDHPVADLQQLGPTP